MNLPSPPPLPIAPPASRSSQPPVEIPAVTPLPEANGYSKDVSTSKSTQSTAWYRTTKGLAIVILVALVVVGVTVGVAVGVTQTKKNGQASGAAMHPNEVASSSNAAGVGATGGATNNVVPINTGILENRPSTTLLPVSN